MENNLSVRIIPWRADIERLLLSVPSSRKPALRRSLREDWLFSTDLPRCASAEDCLRFQQSAQAAGWDAESSGEWIHLRKIPFYLPGGWFSPAVSAEAACLRVLLLRHPGTADPAVELLMLMKAREEGNISWEKACRSLHREWARRLREGKPLPEIRFSDGNEWPDLSPEAISLPVAKE